MLSVSRCYISRFKGQWFCEAVRLTPHRLTKPMPFKTGYITYRDWKRILWDALKAETREIASVYFKNKAKSTRENLRNLEKDLEFKIRLKDGMHCDDEI